jgi:hypothetical protein
VTNNSLNPPANSTVWPPYMPVVIILWREKVGIRSAHRAISSLVDRQRRNNTKSSEIAISSPSSGSTYRLLSAIGAPRPSALGSRPLPPTTTMNKAKERYYTCDMNNYFSSMVSHEPPQQIHKSIVHKPFTTTTLWGGRVRDEDYHDTASASNKLRCICDGCGIHNQCCFYLHSTTLVH